MDQPGLALVRSWLHDVGIPIEDGGATGPTVTWALTATFGDAVQVILMHDNRLPNALQVHGPVQVSPEHQAALTKANPPLRANFEHHLAVVLLARSLTNFQVHRNEEGAPERVLLAATLVLEGLRPHEFLLAVHEIRNAIFDVLLVFQAAFGGAGIPVTVGDAEYAPVVLRHETLGAIARTQQPGETLDEIILRLLKLDSHASS